MTGRPPHASKASLDHPGLYQLGVRSVQGPVERVPRCPVCAAETSYPQFAIENLTTRVLVCTQCGLGRLHPMLDVEEISDLYPDEYYGEPGTKFQPVVERLVRFIGERHITFLSRGLAPGSRILDVGCGRGVVLGALADLGFEVHGLEISAEAARGADPRAEIRLATRLAAAEYPAESFDEIIIWHVLEHLLDPRETLEAAHRILKPGGRLIVAVPNFSSLQFRWTGAAWFHLDLPRHVYHFPLGALRTILADTGYTVGTAYHFSLRQNPFGWIQSVLNQFPSLPRNGLYTMMHRRSLDEPPPFDVTTRVWLWFSLIVGTPFALAATVLETAIRSGASVHVVATR